MGTLNLLTAVDAARQLAQRAITAETLVRDCLDRIADRDHVLHAWKYVARRAAIAHARRLDAGAIRGPLHGLPLAIKDVIDTCDMPTEYGSPIYAGNKPACDAPCVALSRAAGGIVLGKTVTTEFANMNPAETRNPHDMQCTPGGSSSGSAVAVADYMAPLALGTQTAGSVIRPAAFCGVVGYKPSFGLISRVGVKALAETLDTIGLFARCVPDVAMYASVLAGRAPLAQLADIKPRVALCRTYEWDLASHEMKTTLEDCASGLAAYGVSVVEKHLPPDYSILAAAQTDVMSFEQSINLCHERVRHQARLSPRLQGILEAGARLPLERYESALALTKRCRAEFGRLFDDCDVLLAPSAPGPAPRGLDTTGDPLFNRMWTLLGAPCVNLPVAGRAAPMPIGLQVIGNVGHDQRTLAAARFLHQRFT